MEKNHFLNLYSKLKTENFDFRLLLFGKTFEDAFTKRWRLKHFKDLQKKDFEGKSSQLTTFSKLELK